MSSRRGFPSANKLFVALWAPLLIRFIWPAFKTYTTRLIVIGAPDIDTMNDSVPRPFDPML